MIVKHETSHTAAPVAYRIQWANGEVDFLTYIPKGESGVYACEPLYTHPPEPARDAKDLLVKLRGCLQQINEDTGGDNYLNLSCDGMDMIDAAMAQESE